MSITIRPERPGDILPINALIVAAFRGKEYSDGNEAQIVDILRSDGDLSLSLVATNMDQAVIGHIAFSPVTISDGSKGWYGLGPVSVIPSGQNGGIGAMLVEDGLSRIRAMGARGCVLLGNPAYYGRFGFEHDPQLTYPGPPPEYFQRLIFHSEPASGVVRYARAFG